MKKIIQIYSNSNLIIRIFLGIVLGAVFALVIPKFQFVSVFGLLFIGALKSIAPVLVFVLIISSLANAKVGNNDARKYKTIVFLYISSMFLSALVGILASFMFPVTLKLTGVSNSFVAPEGISEVLVSILTNIVSNPINALAEANYISILFWSVIIGFTLKNIAKSTTKDFFKDLSAVMTKVVRGIINCAPFGIMGLVFQAVTENGIQIFGEYAKLLVVLVASLSFVALVVEPFLSFLFIRRNPYPLVFTALRDSGITAFFTRSSAANLPVNMEVCEKLGLDKSFYSISLPLGAAINTNGAAVTISIMSLATVHTLGVQVDIPTAFILSILVTFAACGASGVAGGSLLLIPMACSLFGIGSDISMQVVAIGFIVGVIQDSFETAINSSSDVIYTATAEYHDNLMSEKACENRENGVN